MEKSIIQSTSIFSYKNDITVHHQTGVFQDMKNKLGKYSELNLWTKTIIKWKQNPHNRAFLHMYAKIAKWDY